MLCKYKYYHLKIKNHKYSQFSIFAFSVSVKFMTEANITKEWMLRIEKIW